VASRRLRETVPVLAAGLKHGRKARRKIRRVTRALGGVRELDVTVQILDELARRPDVPREALEDVRAHVLAERDRRRAEMSDRLEHVNLAKLSRRLEQVVAELSAAPPAWQEALALRVARRTTRFERAIEKAGQMYEPERLHQVRIATKKLRYTLELAADAGVAAARPTVGTLKRAQATLGRLHDLHVIQGHVAEVQAHPPARRVGPDDIGLDTLKRLLEEECRHLHARYVKHAPALLDAVRGTRALVIPQLSTIPRRKRPIKMLQPEVDRPAARRA
jgi:CHAD domain-containing protein